MNISELARKLRISPQELRRILNVVGIDIGSKAIKIDKRLAKRVLNEWRDILNDYRRIIKEQEEQEKKEKQEIKAENKEIKIPSSITVREFAALLGIPVNNLIEILMKNGIFLSLNEKMDYETCEIIALDLGVKTIKTESNESEDLNKDEYLSELLSSQETENIKKRPPVVVVMGHVDHGKTKLLDIIRRTNVVKGEAGGITQHIGAYQAARKNRKVTFIDTPGHEAFTAMRSRGAKIADIAILVVAADDGVKPQTIEAIKIAEKANLPFVVAINKIDKPDANPDKVKKELSEIGVVPEDWGGKHVFALISAKTGEGINELLDMVFLLADINEEKLTVDFSGKAVGSIIESHIDKGEGQVATVLIQKGSLKKGDLININQTFAGKIRTMKDYNGLEVEKAEPSTPVRIAGMKSSVYVGDILEAVEEKGKIKKTHKKENKIDTFIKKQDEDLGEDKGGRINVLLKVDVLGSMEVIMESLEKMENDKIIIRVINRGLGNITEADVLQTEGIINNQHKNSRTILVGFNTKITSGAEILAKEKKIDIKLYNVIYNLFDDVEKLIKEIVKPEISIVELGEVQVLKIFKTDKKSMVIGGKVLKGKVEKGLFAEVRKNNKIITKGKIVNLQSGKQEVDLVKSGEECGLLYEGDPIVKENDTLIIFKEEEKK